MKNKAARTKPRTQLIWLGIALLLIGSLVVLLSVANSKESNSILSFAAPKPTSYNKRITPTAPPYATPTYSACNKTLTSFTVSGACMDEGFLRAVVTCADGRKVSMGDNTPASCKTVAQWHSNAKLFCTSCNVAWPTSTPSYTGVPKVTPTPTPRATPYPIKTTTPTSKY